MSEVNTARLRAIVETYQRLEAQNGRLHLRLESLEHYLNQQSILVDTLMTVIMGTYESTSSNDTLQ